MKKSFILISILISSLLLLCSCVPFANILLPSDTPQIATTAPVSPTDTPILETRTYAPTWTDLYSQTASLTPSLTASQTPTITPVSQMRVHFIDVGQGDAMLVQTPNGQTVLIDGGEADTGIVQYLKSLGIQRIDLMIATHPHSDHIGGLVQVLQAFPVTKVATISQMATTAVYEHFLDAISAAQAAFVLIQRGDVLTQDGIDFRCLNPVAATHPNTNENSAVLQFSYGTTTFLLMGDAGSISEADLLAAGLLSKVTVLKVGHHGSTTATSPAFLNVVRPEVAIYFAGINNTFGHPAPQTIAALVAAGASVYGTDKNGTILLTVSLNGYTITTAR